MLLDGEANTLLVEKSDDDVDDDGDGDATKQRGKVHVCLVSGKTTTQKKKKTQTWRKIFWRRLLNFDLNIHIPLRLIID